MYHAKPAEGFLIRKMTLNPALRRAVLIAAKTAGIRALFVTGTEAGPAADPHP